MFGLTLAIAMLAARAAPPKPELNDRLIRVPPRDPIKWDGICAPTNPLAKGCM
jgi:hypothetical protein